MLSISSFYCLLETLH